MTARTLPDLLDPELNARLNLASSLRLATAIAWREPKVQKLMTMLLADVTTSVELVAYLRELSNQPFDQEYEAPHDIALFVGLLALDTVAPPYSVFVENLIVEGKNLFWSRKYAGYAYRKPASSTRGGDWLGRSDAGVTTELIYPTHTTGHGARGRVEASILTALAAGSPPPHVSARSESGMQSQQVSNAA